MKVGDTLPPLVVRARYTDPTLDLGDDISLEADVVLILKRKGAADPTIDRASAGIASVADGIVTLQYDWQAGDTATDGVYYAEFEVGIGGQVLTIPTNGYIAITIEPDLG